MINEITPKVSAILLAAGLSQRMTNGCDKLLLPYRGKALIEWAVYLLNAIPFYEKIIVTTTERLKQLHVSHGIHPIINPHPEDGQSGSLRLGVQSAAGEYYLFMAADQPLLDTAILWQLLDALKENPGKIIRPVVMGKPCNPTIFPASFRKELLLLSGDVGGRAIISAHPKACHDINFINSEAFFDIDSTEDYEKLKTVCQRGV